MSDANERRWVRVRTVNTRGSSRFAVQRKVSEANVHEHENENTVAGFTQTLSHRLALPVAVAEELARAQFAKTVAELDAKAAKEEEESRLDAEERERLKLEETRKRALERGDILPDRDEIYLDKPQVPRDRIFNPDDVKREYEAIAGNQRDHESRRRQLKRLWTGPAYRLLARVSRDTCVEVLRLIERYPNFQEFLELLANQLQLAWCSPSKVATFTPFCLVGDPGIGKTAIVRELAAILGVDFAFKGCAGPGAGFEFSGTSDHWSNGQMGWIARQLIASRHANPLLVLDELDKASLSHRYAGVQDSLLEVLEPTTARTFEDQFLRIKLVASHVLWLATANNADAISGPLRDRFRIVHVTPPSASHMDRVIDSVNRTLRQEDLAISVAFPDQRLPQSIKDALKSSFAPRQMKRHLQEMYARAAARQRTRRRKLGVDIQDLVIPKGTGKGPIGFHRAP